ncbi:MAG: hemin uptake protein HemP [Gammaproteobacteria bacterium]|nr:MAG: hemin uptake protein HemP [Gammaproteobacteria bacterium]
MFEVATPQYPDHSASHRSPAHCAAKSVIPRIESERLLQGGRDLLIDHAGQQYRLHLTRNDKLILTK